MMILEMIFAGDPGLSRRHGAMAGGNIYVGVENLDLEVEETVIDNSRDNNDVDETKIP